MDYEDFLGFIDVLEDIEEELIRIPKRYIRNATNPFEFYSNNQFKQRYRFSKEIITDVILPLVQDELQKPNQRGLPVSPIQQVLITLRFYATASIQVCFSSICISMISTKYF